MSGVPTQANSVNDEIQKWSYFEKMERLKRKILQTHDQIRVEGKPDVSKAHTTDVYEMVGDIQKPHPDWMNEREQHQERVIKVAQEASPTRGGVISLDTYLSQQL